MQVCERASSPLVTILQSEPRKIPGWRLDPRYGPRTATEAALLAVDLTIGSVQPMTRVAAIALTGTTAPYFSIARSLSPQERAMVESGELTLNGVAKYRRQIAEEIAKIA
jgi:hypothetical protein